MTGMILKWPSLINIQMVPDPCKYTCISNYKNTLLPETTSFKAYRALKFGMYYLLSVALKYHFDLSILTCTISIAIAPRSFSSHYTNFVQIMAFGPKWPCSRPGDHMSNIILGNVQKSSCLKPKAYIEPRYLVCSITLWSSTEFVHLPSRRGHMLT